MLRGCPCSNLSGPAIFFGRLPIGGTLQALRGFRHAQMLVHQLARLERSSSADGAVDFTMHFSGFTKVCRALYSSAALVVESGCNGLHQGCQNWIPGSLRDNAMKEHV